MSFFTLTFNRPKQAKLSVLTFLGCVSLLLGSVAAINFSVDPEALYSKRERLEHSINYYVDSLLSSETGMVYAAGDRAIKRRLAVVSEAECFVVGSSRSMQISLREDSWVSDQCPSLANLGVFGAGLEDVVSYLWLIRDRQGKKIFISLDPWVFEFDTDVRWLENEDLYHELVSSQTSIHGNHQESGGGWSLLRNLFNKNYFMASIELIDENGVEAMWEADTINPEEATATVMEEENIILPDGSFSYSKTRSEELQMRNVNGLNKKSEDAVVDEEAVYLLESLVSTIRESGNEVVFVLSPMHPGGLSSVSSGVVDNLQKVTQVSHRLSDRTNSSLLGSFFPAELGCSSSEFYDSIHPKFSCIERLQNKNHR